MSLAHFQFTARNSSPFRKSLSDDLLEKTPNGLRNPSSVQISLQGFFFSARFSRLPQLSALT